ILKHLLTRLKWFSILFSSSSVSSRPAEAVISLASWRSFFEVQIRSLNLTKGKAAWAAERTQPTRCARRFESYSHNKSGVSPSRDGRDPCPVFTLGVRRPSRCCYIQRIGLTSASVATSAHFRSVVT